jgi:hypothetical protein
MGQVPGSADRLDTCASRLLWLLSAAAPPVLEGDLAYGETGKEYDVYVAARNLHAWRGKPR